MQTNKSFQEENVLQLSQKLEAIIEKAKTMEMVFEQELIKVHPIYKKSAYNLLHYLALRTFDIDKIDEELKDIGLMGLSNVEAYVMSSIHDIKKIINTLLGQEYTKVIKNSVSRKKSNKLMRKNGKLLFGYRSKGRYTRIMVTLPNTAADDLNLVSKLLKNGMNCARINCAHDDPETWLKMIKNAELAGEKLHKKYRITMDLGGPKLRTGVMIPGPKVVHIRPEKDDLGRVTNPARIWIAPPDVPPEQGTFSQAFIPIENSLFERMKSGDQLTFVDTRGKNCKITIDKKDGKGRWGVCFDSAYIETGTEIVLRQEKKSGEQRHKVGEILPKEQFILLNEGDKIRLHKNSNQGEPTIYNENGKLSKTAHVSCTLPQIFEDAKIGEPIYFDDGKIEGNILGVSADEILVEITHAKTQGSKLKADKGINLPLSNLNISGLTEKDKEDLKFVAEHADAVNLSFVNSKKDVTDLFEVLKELKSDVGLILKIETQKGFSNLPSILLESMQKYPVGVMIARGDLAIETGWKNFATIQQEIMRICTAAHIPNVWATQVLESLAKKGTPSRAEITDAALSQQAECVMLNKGIYIHKAVKMLDKILRRMQRFQRKSNIILPKLEQADKLILSHKPFDV